MVVDGREERERLFSAGEMVFDPLDAGEDIDDRDDAGPDDAPMTFTQAMLLHKPEAPASKQDTRTAAQKMADLFDEMGDQRSIMVDILSYCGRARPVYEVNAMIDNLRALDYTVYSAANLCALLERAGGLARVDGDGRPYGAMRGAARVVEDGDVRYLEPGTAPQAYWLTTVDGAHAVEDDDPRGRLAALFEAEGRVLELYRRVLLMAARVQGATAVDLTSVVNMDPLAQDPVVTAPHFSVALKRCGALAFTDVWRTTPLGMETLETVFGIARDGLAEAIARVEEAAVPVPPAPDDGEDYYCDCDGE